MISFSSQKLMDMGFTFKYNLEDMIKGAIETCREKGLLPESTTLQENEQDKEFLFCVTEDHHNVHEKNLLHHFIKKDAIVKEKIGCN